MDNDIETRNLKHRLNYLEQKVQFLENRLGFNHSGMDSIKSRLEFLESYSFVENHHEFDSLFTANEISTSGNLFRSYLKKKLLKMYEIISIPPNVTKISKQGNEVYNFDKFPPYDKVEKLFHQSLLMLLFASPSFSKEFLINILELIHHLRGCYWVSPGILEWILKPNDKDLKFVKENFQKIYDELSSHNPTLI